MIRVLLAALGIMVLLLALSVTSCRSAQKDELFATAGEKTAEGGADAARDANKILDRARARDTHITITEERHRDAILAAPGADAPLDPGFVDAVNRGLCEYASTPGCAEVLGQHP